MAVTTIYSARHGETPLNVQFRLCGRIDVPLTDKGLGQAGELAASLAGKGIERIYCSDLLRARQTAEIVGKALGVLPVPDARLRESDFGAMERCPRDDPEYDRRKRAFAERFPGGGESILQAAHRVYGFLDEILPACAGQTILLVSHGWTNKMIASYFRELTNEEFGSFVLPNGGYAVYQYDAEGRNA